MLDQAKHRKIIISLLSDIYSDHRIAHLLGFKGGTALYLFHGLNRFSVDLDFDLFDPSREDFVFEVILELMSKYGVIKDKAIKKVGILIAVFYESGLHSLKIDISNRQSSAQYEVKTYLGIPMQVMSLEDISANKFIALLDRSKPADRDAFDCHFILVNNFPINHNLIYEKTGLTLKEYLSKCIIEVEAKFQGNLLHGLGELVDPKQKAWVKNNLKKEFLLRLQIHLASLSC